MTRRTEDASSLPSMGNVTILIGKVSLHTLLLTLTLRNPFSPGSLHGLPRAMPLTHKIDVSASLLSASAFLLETPSPSLQSLLTPRLLLRALVSVYQARLARGDGDAQKARVALTGMGQGSCNELMGN